MLRGVTSRGTWAVAVGLIAVAGFLSSGGPDAASAAWTPKAASQASSLPPGALASLGFSGEEAGYSLNSGCFSCFGGRWNSPSFGFNFDANAATSPFVLVPGPSGDILAFQEITEHGFSNPDYGDVRVLTLARDGTKITAERRIPMGAWDWTGGVAVSPDGRILLLVWRYNESDAPGFTVAEIRTYGADLTLLDRVPIRAGIDDFGIGSVGDFSGDPSMLVSEDTLVVHSSREIFRRPGEYRRHQANLTVALDLRTQELRQLQTHVGHSFSQYARRLDGDLVLLDHGDGYPRASTIRVIHGFYETPAGDEKPDGVFDVIPIPGKTGDPVTGMTVSGLEVGGGRALTTGISVPHGRSVAGVTGSSTRLVGNVYLTSTDLATGRTSFRWVTEIDPASKTTRAGEPRLVKISADRYALLFTVYSKSRAPRMEYRLLDSTGKVQATHAWQNRNFAPVSQPVMAGNRLLWAGRSQRDLEGSNWLDTLRGYTFGLDLARPKHPVWTTAR